MPQPYAKSLTTKSAAKKYCTPCKYFQRGRCTNSRCPYLHVQSSPDGGASGLDLKVDGTLSNNTAADVMKTMLKLFFEKKQNAIYSMEQGLLNLSSLSNHEDLQPVSSSINFNTKTFCEALCRCIQELIMPLPSALCLEDNHITTTFHLAGAMQEVGLDATLRVLSLERNDVKTIDGVLPLKPFTRLIELNLTGNPVTVISDYRQSVIKQMPFLLGLDGLTTTDGPLCLPWPHFNGLEEQRNSTTGDPPRTPSSLEAIYLKASSSPSLSVEKAILKFLCMNVFGPFEYNELSAASNKNTGGGNSINELADAYTSQATLSLSLSCPEAAVATPLRTSNGQNPSTNRTVIREIVGFRMRQTECDHNLVHGIRSTRVAVGRVRVCAQLEHWLYPPSFFVKHYLHPSVNVVDMGVTQGFNEFAVATVHGVMAWHQHAAGPKTSSGGCNSDGLVIMRNFTRSFTLAPRMRLSADDIAYGNIPAEGGWVILNDMVTLMPFSLVEDVDAHETSLVLANSTDFLFGEKVHAYGVLFSPATDPRRICRYSRRYDVPVSVVEVLCVHLRNDASLVEVLTDLSGTPLDVFQQLAVLVGQNPMAAVFLCRLEKCYGVQSDTGIEILKRYELNWEAIQNAMQTSASGTMNASNLL